MKLFSRAGLIAVLAAVGLGSLALAQVPGLFIASPIGTEQIEVRVPSTTGVVISPQMTEVTVSQLRDASGYRVITQTSPITVNVPNGVSIVTLTGATSGNATVVMAPNPVDGQKITIYSQAGVGTLTLTANTGQTIGGTPATSITALDNVSLIYQASTATWFSYQ